MINYNSTTTRNNKVSSNVHANPLNQGKAQDYALYRHRRARFLQQSALYLGADLSDSNVLSLCFSDNPVSSK
jgi:hypothetical protein